MMILIRRLNLKILILPLVILALMSCSSQEPWTDLFNGKDIDNWQLLNGHAEFTIENNSIKGISSMNTPNTFLATKTEYDNFILEYDVKMEDGLNSGVQIRSLSLPEYRNGRVYSYQIELDASPRSWSGGIYDEARRGWLYNLECNPPAKKAYKHNDWNHFRIEAIGNSIRVWLNGIPTADLIDDVTPKGFIALQVHGIKDESLIGKTVEFRNIRIITENPENYATQEFNEIPQNSYLTNTLTEREKAEGWSLLWDGKTTQGWRGAKLETFPQSGWEINDGLLSVLDANGQESANGGDIVTVKKYKDFELELDFIYTKGANSGIKYFVDTGLNMGAGSSIGCEYQILDDLLHPDAKLGTDGNRTLASLYDIIPANAYFYTPNEQHAKRINKYGWNRAKITVRGKHVEHFLNGIKVLEYDRGTQMWRALVARSKYHVWPNFGELEEGHILLQDHGHKVSYKNIKIKESGV